MYHRVATKDIIERLAKVERFGECSVTVIEQDSASVLNEIDIAQNECAGPVVIVAVTEIINHPPAVEVTVTLNIREHVPTNRENGNHLTAMDVAILAAKELDSPVWRFMSCQQTSPEDGILEVNASFKGLVGEVEEENT